LRKNEQIHFFFKAFSNLRSCLSGLNSRQAGMVAMAEKAINAAIDVVRKVVNSAIGWDIL